MGTVCSAVVWRGQQIRDRLPFAGKRLAFLALVVHTRLLGREGRLKLVGTGYPSTECTRLALQMNSRKCPLSAMEPVVPAHHVQVWWPSKEPERASRRHCVAQLSMVNPGVDLSDRSKVTVSRQPAD